VFKEKISVTYFRVRVHTVQDMSFVTESETEFYCGVNGNKTKTE